MGSTFHRYLNIMDQNKRFTDTKLEIYICWHLHSRYSWFKNSM